ncbi:hypothetical protein [Aerococcus sp. UMB7834]|uniref:hypothetical protein n=1 Tax=Aerococcus sp. UMB7834 TaxID=3046342 RepID=UPI00254AD9F4|nr:hypothetical protein [Aerococcus sp. UMB7834]MDK6804737.1 hypothetical protein [Aerococcus sp. UMB7834]
MQAAENKKIREKQTKKVIKFNRFLWQRYSLTLFFFVNLYWFIFTIGSHSLGVLLPLVLLVSNTMALIEQFKLYNRPSNHLKCSRKHFIYQLLNLIVVVISLFSQSLFEQIFPFIAYQSSGIILIVMTNLLGGILSLLNLHAVKAIYNNNDDYYRKINNK